MDKLFLSKFIIGVFCVVSANAHALRCAPVVLDQAYFDKHDVIFVGDVQNLTIDKHTVEADVKVTFAWKGAKAGDVRRIVSNGMWQYFLQEDNGHVFIFGVADEGNPTRYNTPLCGFSRVFPKVVTPELRQTIDTLNTLSGEVAPF